MTRNDRVAGRNILSGSRWFWTWVRARCSTSSRERHEMNTEAAGTILIWDQVDLRSNQVDLILWSNQTDLIRRRSKSTPNQSDSKCSWTQGHGLIDLHWIVTTQNDRTGYATVTWFGIKLIWDQIRLIWSGDGQNLLRIKVIRNAPERTVTGWLIYTESWWLRMIAQAARQLLDLESSGRVAD